MLSGGAAGRARACCQEGPPGGHVLAVKRGRREGRQGGGGREGRQGEAAGRGGQEEAARKRRSGGAAGRGRQDEGFRAGVLVPMRASRSRARSEAGWASRARAEIRAVVQTGPLDEGSRSSEPRMSRSVAVGSRTRTVVPRFRMPATSRASVRLCQARPSGPPGQPSRPRTAVIEDDTTTRSRPSVASRSALVVEWMPPSR